MGIRLNHNRVRCLKDGEKRLGPVVYWMNREQRCRDNWTLLYAQDLALALEVPLVVVYCVVPTYLESTIRHYDFMIKGLKELEPSLENKNIPFFLQLGNPSKEIPKFIKKVEASILVTDFEPLRMKMRWKFKIGNQIDIPMYEVDARNVVPCWIASNKQEFSAFTIRRKIEHHLDEYLGEFPALKKHPYIYETKTKRRGKTWKTIEKNLDVDRSVPLIDWLQPGSKAAKKILKDFIRDKLISYDLNFTDPVRDGLSSLAPYLHFGQISAQRVVLDVMASEISEKQKKKFLDKIIFDRELADNYCFYNPYYDSIRGLPHWAYQSLIKHKRDPRPYNYSRLVLEQGKTHDPLWNTAQIEMVKTGKMHGFMRIYWAKKILEWVPTPQEAIKIATYLNNKYELDGIDPNGYAGIMWAIGGLYDRAWKERPIFGRIRYVGFDTMRKKFNLPNYIEKIKKIPFPSQTVGE